MCEENLFILSIFHKMNEAPLLRCNCERMRGEMIPLLNVASRSFCGFTLSVETGREMNGGWGRVDGG